MSLFANLAQQAPPQQEQSDSVLSPLERLLAGDTSQQFYFDRNGELQFGTPAAGNMYLSGYAGPRYGGYQSGGILGHGLAGSSSMTSNQAAYDWIRKNTGFKDKYGHLHTDYSNGKPTRIYIEENKPTKLNKPNFFSSEGGIIPAAFGALSLGLIGGPAFGAAGLGAGTAMGSTLGATGDINAALKAGAIGAVTGGLASYAAPGLNEFYGAYLPAAGAKIATGATIGAGTGATTAAIRGDNVAGGALTGGLTGGLQGGISAYSPQATSYLQQTGVNPTLSRTIVGALGRGVLGATGAALNNGNVEQGLYGGLASGGISNATSGFLGSPLSGALGKLTGQYVGSMFNKPQTAPQQTNRQLTNAQIQAIQRLRGA